MILILILLLNLDSGESNPSVCQQGTNMKVLPSLITKHSFATPDGYKIDWKAAIQPIELAECFDTVTLHYNGKPKTKCCDGYEAVIKRPRKTGDTQPFLVPLCGNHSTVFISFKLGKSKYSPEIQMKNLPSCPSRKGWVFYAAIATGVAFLIIMVICIIICCIKSNRNKEGDEESTGSSEEESGSGSSSESSRSRKSSKASSTRSKSRSPSSRGSQKRNARMKKKSRYSNRRYY